MRIDGKRPALVERLKRWYGIAGVVVLLSTTVVWAWSTARVQLENADQLVDGLLFTDASTFHGAIFPRAHTQLLKWPLFWLVARLHNTATAYMAATVLLALCTVAATAYVLYRLDRRPVVFGTLCLLFATMLLLVPAQVLDGAVSEPLSLAMLTGRNVEYVLFLAVLAGYVRAAGWRSWRFGAATLGVALLIASDQLFLYMSVGGAALAATVGWLAKRQDFYKSSVRWLAGSCAGWLIAVVVLAAIGHSLTHIAAYPLGVQRVQRVYQMREGVVHGLRALELNVGLTLRAGWLTLPALVAAGFAAGAALWAAVWLVRRISARSQHNALPSARAYDFAAMMVCATAIACSLYIFTNQSEVGNARYEGVCLFTGIVVLAVWACSRQWRAAVICSFGGAVLIAIIFGLAGVLHHSDHLARNTLAARNQHIVTALAAHHVTYLMGNYWRVFPVRLQSQHASQLVVPLEGCLQPTSILTSSIWRPDVQLHSFAYLVTQDQPGIPALPCRPQLAFHRFGRPTTTVVIAGARAHPTEELLFYQNGAADQLQIIPAPTLCRPPRCPAP